MRDALAAVTAVEQVTAVLLVLAFLAGYLFAVRPVKRSPESWYLLGSNAAFAVLLLLGATVLIFGRDYPGRDFVRAGAYALVVAVFAAQLGLLLSAFRRRKRG